MSGFITEKQLAFLWGLPYLSKDEIRDFLQGYTTLEVLLDIDDLTAYEQIGQEND